MTLTEICVVSVVLLSLTFITLPYYLDYFAKDEVEIKARELVNIIHQTRIKAMQKCSVDKLNKYGTETIFYPNGKCTDAEFIIRGNKYRAVVSLRGMTGKTSYKLYKEKKHNVREEYDK